VNVLFGFLFATIMGMGFPLLGWIFMEQIFVMYTYGFNENFREDSNFWCLIIFIIALVEFVSSAISKSLFGAVTENITKGIREISYRGILSKDMGWFDDHENSSG